MYSLNAFRNSAIVYLIAGDCGYSHLTFHPWVGDFAEQFTPVEWEGMHAWNLGQLLYKFAVGVRMPFSFTRRWQAGKNWPTSLRHVLRRCALLILFSLVARSIQTGAPLLDLINVLTATTKATTPPATRRADSSR